MRDNPPGFKSALALRTWVEVLPGGPKWNLDEIKLEGYMTDKPIRLLWRDGQEVIDHIFGNPVFANHMNFDPLQQFMHSANPNIPADREFSEFTTGEFAWK